MGEQPYITDIVGRHIGLMTGDPATTAPLHEWQGEADGHNCAGCPRESIWRCDEKAHIWRCECDATDDEAARYHGGNTDGCPREAYHPDDVVTSPQLCLACLHGCAE